MTRLFPAFARIAGKPRIRIRAVPRPDLHHAVARPLADKAALTRQPRPAVRFHDWAAI